MNSGRFLDPPEFTVFHDKGNEENLFDRVDFQLSKADSIHLNLGFTRSWFQTPNSFDNLNAGVTDPVAGNPVAPRTSVHRSRLSTLRRRGRGCSVPMRCSRSAHSCGATSTTITPAPIRFLISVPSSKRRVTQDRTLTNTGLRSDISYVKGIHNLKAGATYQQTFLDENTQFGIVDPALNAPCFDADGNAVPWVGSPGLNDPANCGSAVSTNPAL